MANEKLQDTEQVTPGSGIPITTGKCPRCGKKCGLSSANKTGVTCRKCALQFDTKGTLIGATGASSAPKKKPKKLWVLHQDDPQGYEVFLHKTKAGAYDDVLGTIETAVNDMGLVEEDEEDLFAAIKAKDGKAALKAWKRRISAQGGDAVHDLYLWVSKQEVLT